MKSISITRLKHSAFVILDCTDFSEWPWNEKHLDYEIETRMPRSQIPHTSFRTLEMKSISITRLKLTKDCFQRPMRQLWTRVLKWKASRLRDWNTRYEKSFTSSLDFRQLEMKSISITRLKQICKIWLLLTKLRKDLKWKASRLRDWNEKVFKASPETCDNSKRTWNEKHLDYEIETILTPI